MASASARIAVIDTDRILAASPGVEREKRMADLRPVVDAVAKEMGLAAVFERSGLHYASDAIDVSETVIRRLNDPLSGRRGR